MDYSQLSDFEINQRVSNAIPGRFIFYPDYVWDSEWEKTFDPCNKAADAWPIIEKNYIALHPLKHKSMWIAVSDDQEYRFRDAKPMRAAMVIFLMSKESFNA